jgi:flavin reductase (DIM6/NTAB) family NADH-FMN oxidoreductase RutF
MLTLNCKDLSTIELQNYLQYAIAPRPICFASTIDSEGKVNLSPFSFFNLFSTNPPICVFSPSRRIRDNTTKHTLENVLEVKECVINIVNYEMVQQMSLSSTEYPKGVNEFEKAGFTMLPSKMVLPPRVAESPVQLECIVNQVIPLGTQNGAGNLIIAEIKLIHINESILDPNRKIDQEKMDLVARLGGDWYCRVTADNLFKIPKPLTSLGIGVDSLPISIRNSTILTGNDLGILGNQEKVPTENEINSIKKLTDVKNILENPIFNDYKKETQLHQLIHQLLTKGLFEEAIKIAFLEL